jgi:hypothetical protein
LVSHRFLDAARWRRQALAAAGARGKSILAASFSRGHPLEPIASGIIRKLPRSLATISGLAELQGVADRAAAIVKQAVRCTDRAAFTVRRSRDD